MASVSTIVHPKSNIIEALNNIEKKQRGGILERLAKSVYSIRCA